MDRKGRLLVISGPSGVGKGTIVSKITEHLGETVRLSISATTRDPREGEINGVHYFFLSEDEFLEKVRKNEFLEYAFVHGHYYGTPKPPAEAALSEGRDVILEIDVQGAMQVKENSQDGVYIFILPPSIEELRNRLTKRGTESEQDLQLRMSKALAEIDYLDKYDYAVVNDDLQSAVQNVLSIIEAEHSRINDEIVQIMKNNIGKH